MKPRINIYEQISAFYSFVYENPDKINKSHVALYMFLINQNNRSNWSEWFKLPYDLAMSGACIGSKGTYYKCLNELQSWKLIRYKKGENDYKAPQISIIVLSKNEQLTVPLSEPLTVPLTGQLSEQLSVLLTGNIDILITSNYKLITDNIKKWIKSELDSIEKPKRASRKFVKPTIHELTEFIKINSLNVDAEYFFNHYESNGWKVGKSSMSNWKTTLNNWHKREKEFKSITNNTSNQYDPNAHTLKIINRLERDGGISPKQAEIARITITNSPTRIDVQQLINGIERLKTIGDDFNVVDFRNSLRIE